MKVPPFARSAETLALLLTLFAAAALRLYGVCFGLPSMLHPDEFSFVYFPLNFYSLDLNPHFFTYPTLHYYLLALLYAAVFALQAVLGAGLSLEQFAALHYFYDQHALLYWARLSSVFYGVGTALWAAAIAGQLYGPAARWHAAALVAVGTVLARQSVLAGVDAPMLFWFAAALYAAVRLVEHTSLRSYLCAAVLVGIAAACKYPAALAASGILAAHLLARRPFFDRRLWLAAAISLISFALCSPYVFLDLSTFFAHFSGQAKHLGSGHGTALGRGWWYHLYFSLPHNGGWLALALFAVSAAYALYRRHAPSLVVLGTFLSYYLVMGYGQSVFTRYALPLMLLQAVLAVGPLQRIADKRWRTAALVLLIAQPLYNTLQQTRLLATTDTRSAAREWIERHIPPGEAIANFGGWAGDVPVRTFEELWWRISHFERVFGREQLDRALPFLAQRGLSSPYYSYAIQRTNIAAQSGSFSELERLQTGWIVLHNHTLPYSHIDSSFKRALSARAERRANFAPSSSDASYDPQDAFYIPLSNGDAVDRPGPQIEIWRLHNYPKQQKKEQSPHTVFAQAYVRGATEALGKREHARALELASRALALDPNCADAYYATALIHHIDGALAQAAMLYEKQLALGEDAAALMNLALIHEKNGDGERRAETLQRAVAAAPWLYEPLHRLVSFYRQQGQFERALNHLHKHGGHFAERADFRRDVEQIYSALGDTSAGQMPRQ